AVLDDGCRLVIFIAARSAERHREGELEILHVGPVDRVQWREAVRAIIAVIHQPVAWLRIGEPIERDLGRKGTGQTKGRTSERAETEHCGAEYIAGYRRVEFCRHLILPGRARMKPRS